MAAYAPVSSVVVSGADRNYDGIPDALQGGRAFSPRSTYAPVSSVVVSGADRNYDGIPDVLQGGRAFSPKSTYAPVSSVVVSGADRNYDGIPDVLQGGRASGFISEPRGFTTNERQLVGEELALPKFEIVEKLVEVAHVHEKDLVVEVPEVHHHKLTKCVPVYEEVFRDIPTEVRQIHQKEEVQVASQWVTEEVDIVVPRVTVREIKTPVLIPRNHVENMIVEVPVALPGVQRVHERSIVDFKPFVHHVKGPTEIKRYETDVIEVPHVVEVPRHVPVPKEEYRIETKTVVVPHVRRVEKVVEVPEVRNEVVEVQIPQLHTLTTVKHVPKFVAGALYTREIEGEDQQVVVVDALRQARGYLVRLEATKRDLAVQLELRWNQLNASQTSLDEELRVRVQLEAQLLQAQSKMSTRYVESVATTYGSGGQVQNSPYQVTSLEGVESPAWCGGRSFSPKLTYAPVSSVLVSGADRNYDGIPDVLQGGRAFSPKSTYAPVSSVVVSGADRNYDGIPDALQGGRAVYQAAAPVSSVVVSGVDRNYDGIPDALQGGRAVYQARAPVSSVVVSGVDRNYDGIPDALQGGRAVY